MSLKCLEPVRIRHGDDYIYVSCGHCEACAYNKQADWATRLEFESKSYPRQSILFLGLSYNDEHLPENGTLVKRDVQLFLKRLRKYIYPRKCRFFLAGEYGEERNRPHYHVILFGVTADDLKLYADFYSRKVRGTVGFSRLWHDKSNAPIGRVTVQNINPAHYSYVAKYATKKYHGQDAQDWFEFTGTIPEFVQMSRNPGIGRETCLARVDRLRRDGAIWIKPGVFKPLPRYFVDLIFPDKEDLEYRDWRDRRVQYAMDAQRKFSDDHPNLSREECRNLQKLQTLRKLETIKRKKGYVKKSINDIFAQELARIKEARFFEAVSRIGS